MSINIHDINKIALLSRIEITDDHKLELIKNLGKIINWMAILNEVDTKNIEPLINVHQATLKMVNDKVADDNIAELVLKNTPNAKYNYFTVPKMIE
jgi:aspartyl-tRNA(Asn)/glutamyl-tRNA(Gln) amidotransferase subunit C